MRKKSGTGIRYNLPQGVLIGYKKVAAGRQRQRLIAVLEIPADADAIKPIRNFNARISKCRASKAKVLAFYEYDYLITRILTKPAKTKTARSTRWASRDFQYRLGRTAYPKYDFDQNCDKVCSSGIHFFMTAKKAITY